jgi:hypothetical protein
MERNGILDTVVENDGGLNKSNNSFPFPSPHYYPISQTPGLL